MRFLQGFWQGFWRRKRGNLRKLRGGGRIGITQRALHLEPLEERRVLSVAPTFTPGPLTDGSLVTSVQAGSSVTLDYESSAATGQALVTASTDLALSVSGHALSDVTANLTIGSQTSTVDYGHLLWSSGHEAPDSTGPYQFSVPVPPGLPTGSYPYTLTIDESYSGSGTDSITLTGNVDILNRSGSPFGAGWTLDGLDQLAISSEYLVTLVKSDGTMGDFTSEDGSTFASPAGEFAYMNLSYADGQYTLTGRDGAAETFDSSGRLLTAVDNDGNVTTYTWSDDGPLASIAYPNGQTTSFGYPSGTTVTITDFDSRETTLALTDGELTSIVDNDPNNSYVSGETTPETDFDYNSNEKCVRRGFSFRRGPSSRRHPRSIQMAAGMSRSRIRQQ